jgi:hypothetical protein
MSQLIPLLPDPLPNLSITRAKKVSNTAGALVKFANTACFSAYKWDDWRKEWAPAKIAGITRRN